MKNKRSFLKSNLLALTMSCFALTAFGCTKSDSLGGVGVADGGPDGGGKDITGCQSSGAYSSKCDAPPAPDVSSNSDSGSDTPYVPAAGVCDQLTAAARAQVESYLQSTSSLACQVDSDCSDLFLQSWDCFAACGQLIRTADITAATAATASVCDEYFGAGCPGIYPPCALRNAFCDRGTCARGFGPVEPSGSADAAVDAGFDSPVDAGDPVDGGAEDGGSEDGGTVQCNFSGVSQALTCADHEYCMAFGGGMPLDSGVSYTCAPFPDACLADRSCACVCSTAVSNPGSYCAVRGQQCLCSVSQGILTLLCSIP
jgi:hypothetical protein